MPDREYRQDPSVECVKLVPVVKRKIAVRLKRNIFSDAATGTSMDMYWYRRRTVVYILKGMLPEYESSRYSAARCNNLLILDGVQLPLYEGELYIFQEVAEDEDGDMCWEILNLKR